MGLTESEVEKIDKEKREREQELWSSMFGGTSVYPGMKETPKGKRFYYFFTAVRSSGVKN